VRQLLQLRVWLLGAMQIRVMADAGLPVTMDPGLLPE
jgi:16S rRNA C1402 (ribose-2'-O) methylase RsmI